MAAPLKTFAGLLSTFRRRPCLHNWTRCYARNYWEKGEDSVYEIGETRRDRYVNVPQRTRPHPETPRRGQYELNSEKGKIFDRKPFPVKLKAGKRYKWCSCGYSHRQPLCDASHKTVYQYMGANFMSWQYPVTFEVEKDGTYWLCNCKQTNNRPFCDGTHRQEGIQKKKS